jgi:hypothetical protein
MASGFLNAELSSIINDPNYKSEVERIGFVMMKKGY